MLHKFELAQQKKIRLWQKKGETYEHILMKALGFAMFSGEYPTLEIEVAAGLRYKPDLLAREQATGSILFWGECGLNTIRKTGWLARHSGAEIIVLFKIGFHTKPLIAKLRKEIPKKYRPKNRLTLINFDRNIVKLTGSKKIESVSADWFKRFEV